MNDQTPDDTADERLVWGMAAAIARDDEEGWRFLLQAADEQTVRDALIFAIGGSIGALARAAVAETPGADIDRDWDITLEAIARSMSRKALELAGNYDG